MGKDKLEEQNRKPRRLQRRSTETADWQAADAELVKRCISAAAKDGGALRFGYSRDGGAYAVGIYPPHSHEGQCRRDIYCQVWLYQRRCGVCKL